jgi:hypothetical protein
MLKCCVHRVSVPSGRLFVGMQTSPIDLLRVFLPLLLPPASLLLLLFYALAPLLLLRHPPRPMTPIGASRARRSAGPWCGSPPASPPATAAAPAADGGGHTRIRCMLQVYISNALEVCCKCFIHMLDVAYVAMVVHVCCKRLSPMFHLFFSHVCCNCVYLDVAYVSHICCKYFIWMLRIFAIVFKRFCKCFRHMFKCFSYVFKRILQVLHLDVLKVD